MGRKTLENQINTELRSRISFGESKHEDKINNDLGFGKSTYKIYSYTTYNTYKLQLDLFARWLKSEKEIKYIDIKESEKYVKEYLDYEKEKGCSLYTLKMQRSAFAMLYKHTIEYKLDKRSFKDVKRSRNANYNRHYNLASGKWKDLALVCRSTGGRRCDIVKMKKNDFFEIDNRLFVKIEKSKGGRDRVAYVRNADEIKAFLADKKDNELLFSKLPRKIDIHAMRREYAQALYKDVLEDRELRDDILKQYPQRHEVRTRMLVDGRTVTREVKRDIYKCDDVEYDRDNAYLVTQCLGHNRLSVCVNHYLYNT